jgi:hypothetical protein
MDYIYNLILLIYFATNLYPNPIYISYSISSLLLAFLGSTTTSLSLSTLGISTFSILASYPIISY